MTDTVSPRSSATRISDKLFIAPQPGLNAFPDLAAAGFKSLISNRPGGEQLDQRAPRPSSRRRQREAWPFISSR
jgi:protein tyrosine phosphatase (PTP) superfamily phosphohydrolase (DUF442 family)